MKALKEWFIEAPWGNIAMMSWGDPAGEKVLLVHGRQDSAATFVPLLQLLPAALHYVALDLPGHGLSDAFPAGEMLSRIHFVTPVALVVQHLKWKSFTYLSHSMGGEIGLFFNAAYPNLIKKFIHLDVGLALHNIRQKPFTTFYEAYEKYYNNYSNYNVDDRVYSKERARQSVMGARGVPESVAELLLSRNLRLLPGGGDQYRLSWDKRLKNLTSLNLPHEQMVYLFTTNVPPSLFIAATDSCRLYRGQDADRLVRAMQARVAGFRLAVVEGGHDVHVTHPARVAPLVAAALADAAKAKL